MWLSGKNIFLQNFLFKSFFLAYLRWLLRDKYLKNLILQATKESSNLGIYGLPSGIFGIREYVWGCYTISIKNIQYKSFIQLNFWRVLQSALFHCCLLVHWFHTKWPSNNSLIHVYKRLDIVIWIWISWNISSKSCFNPFCSLTSSWASPS